MLNIIALLIIQYNVNKSTDKVIIPLFKELDLKTYYILAIQEPQKNPRVKIIVKHPIYRTIFLQKGEARTYFLVSKVLALEFQQEIIYSIDLITLTINTSLRTIYIYNYYNPLPLSYTSIALGTLLLLLEALSRPRKHIFLRDFNLYYPLQKGIIFFTYYSLLDNLIKVATIANLNLALLRGTITRRTNNSESILDLIFTFYQLEKRILRYEVFQELKSSSNYLLLQARARIEKTSKKSSVKARNIFLLLYLRSFLLSSLFRSLSFSLTYVVQ